MRVLFVNENIGGHTTVHHHLEHELREHPDVDAEFLHVPPRRGLRRLAGAAVPGLARFDLDLQPLRAQLALSRWVDRRLRTRADGFDVIHVYTQNAVLTSTDVLAAHPSVVSVDSTNELNAFLLPHRRPTRWTARLLPITLRFERKVFDAATLVVSSSEYAARSLRSTYGVGADRLRILPMGIPVPREAPRREPASGLPVITFVGKTLARKGGHLLLDVHQQRLASRCTLVLVTKDRVPELPNVRTINDLDVGDARLGEILAESSVFVFPSEIDQSPNAVLEAMAAGVPVIAGDVGAIPEMVTDGVTGVLVPPGDGDALARAIEDLLDDPARRASMGAAGRARVIERYDVRSATTELVGLLSEARHRFESR
jgi:glycosyltransferase involved in cell wall biosynthesis